MDMRAEPVRVAALMLRSPQGRILMMRRVDDGTWAFPAGHANDGELPEQTAVRETWEETGYRTVGPVRRLMQRIRDGVDAVTFINDCAQEFAPTLNHEHDAWMWVEPQAAMAESETIDPLAEQDAKRPKRKARRPRADAKKDDFDPDQPRDEAGRWTGLGMPAGTSIKDQQVEAAQARGAHELKVIETPDRKPSWDGKKPLTLKIGAKGGTPYTPRAGRPGKTASYDPKLAHLVTQDKGQPYLERTYAVPNDEASTRITPLKDPDVIYRGMSAEEYEALKTSGVTKSKGGYNIGSDQEGLSYWTTDPEMANSYANSFAPWQQKPTFEKPAYILAMKRPKPEETKHVEGTGEAEVGVNRAVQKDEILSAWRGSVYDHEDGEFDLTQNSYDDKPEYRTGGGTAPSARVSWAQLASPFEEEAHADALTSDHERVILDALTGLEGSLRRMELRHDGRADDFNPAEPREPQGGSTGGRWTSVAGGGAGQAQGNGGAGADPAERAGGGRAEPSPGGHGSGNLGRGGSGGLSGGERHQLSPAQPDKFHAALRAAKASNPHAAAVAIYTPAEYAGMKTFMTDDGKAGVAVKPDGDIVSVFKAADGPKGVADMALHLAVENGGKKLDCFDTVLPSLYAKNGFKVVARLKFNPEFAPEDWDANKFARYNGGQPDVVFMTYDPEHASSQGGQPVNSYDEAVALQDQEIASRGEIVAQGDKAAAEIGRKWKDASPATDVDQLLQLAGPHQNELATLSVKVAQEVDNGTKVQNPGVKSRQSLIEKTTVRGKKVGDITDAVRLGFEMNGSPEVADKLVQRLASDDHLKVADEGWRKVKGSGYFDRTIKVRFADGVVGEVQLWPPGMFKAKEANHPLYEQSRVLPEDDPRQAEIQRQMAIAYNTVAQQLPDEWRKLVPS
jgi:8-oxo-dGTP pyrophosphatase MutT (NUDIX family)